MSKSNKVQVAVFQKAKKGNDRCGDSYFYKETKNEFVCALVDGLGSGKYAKESSEAVIDVIKNNVHASMEQLVHICSERLSGKRGVVLGVLKVNFDSGKYSFFSIGNIGAIVITRDNKRIRNMPNFGFLGGYRRDFKVMQDTLEDDMKFIIFSDGVHYEELKQIHFFNNDVDEQVLAFSESCLDARRDDTTLMAIHCSNG